MRLSRKALAVLGGAAGLLIGGALIYALEPATPTRRENVYHAETPGRPGPLAGSPADYGALADPGPPRPADLASAAVPLAADGGAGSDEHAAHPAPAREPGPKKEARLRARQEREAARASRLFLEGRSATAEPGAGAPRPMGEAEASRRDRNESGSRSAFLAERAVTPESRHRLHDPSSPRVLQAGSIIPAALITAVHSDLPGQVTAQVTQNVYDSPTGALLLIPQGARLIGEYASDVAAGQSRVLLAWDRLILPGGRSLELGRLPGSDASGKAGIGDRTDYHWGAMTRAALVSSLLGIGAELGSGSDEPLLRALRESGQDTVHQTGRRLVERQVARPPTVTVRAGAALHVLVTRDLIFETGAGS
ncbi:TrbI/VirB10 family protein [Sphingopyxis flava]|nr:TrbI/VirB10 family protein [Sphingopyxis flava]